MASTTKVRLRRYNGTDYDFVYLSANLDDVIDTLPVENGGTGASSSASGVYGLITTAASLSGSAIEGTDYMPILDASGNVGKKASMGSIMLFVASYCNATINVTSPSGTAVTVSYRGSTVSTHTGTGSAVPVVVNHKGTWTMTGTLNGVTSSVDVEVTGDGVYDATISFFTNPLNTDQLTLGMNTVYFTAYPDLKWCVDHLDGDYAYLGLYNASGTTQFGSNTTYSGSTIAAKCTTFLNNTIPNVADYLESVTVNGVTSKVFIPSYKMFFGTANPYGGDYNDPTFDWPSASPNNRAACVSNWSAIDYDFWLSSLAWSNNVWFVDYEGNPVYISPASGVGFRPEVKVRYKEFVNPLNTDQLTLGMDTVYFNEYPSLKWQVQHLDGDYVYLALTETTELTTFGTNTIYYNNSTIAAKCTTFLNNTIPNVADYLERVTVNDVTNKVFIPSYKMLSGNAASGGGDANDPTFDWPSASAANRICKYNGSATAYWLSSPYDVYDPYYVWFVNPNGGIDGSSPNGSYGFRPAVKVRYKV